jgi:hypothetical protein
MFGLDHVTVGFAPLLPWPILIAAGGLAAAVLALALFRRARGVWWRGLAVFALWITLANPALINEKREPRKDIGVVVVDDSASQSIENRRAQTEAALSRVMEAARAMPDLELRVVRVGDSPEGVGGDGGTRLFGALDRAMTDISRRRFAGAIFITDGQIHDAPADLGGLPPGPIHALITGRPDEMDRRLVVVRAPTYGLVDKSVTMTLRVEDSDPAARDPVSVTITRDGLPLRVIQATPNRDVDVEVPLVHGGQTIVEMSVPKAARELTDLNNRAVVAVNGIRDRLRVLLVSGEPHAGERTWRNLLKADPSVDLVHFTILRPPEKQDGTPINELSLIAFPIRELFEVKLKEFDLIIFDRYRRRNILPANYLRAIAQYVEDGGALLEAAGPTFATGLSLFRSPLGEYLPGEPTGKVIERPFKARLTDIGRRHPVTADLDGVGAPGSEPSWGKWYRQIEVTARRGETVMAGADGLPLVLLDRVGKGRIAQILSDHIWLWTRGYDGGGPQAELLRRVSHWLMKEPQLEEEDLSAAFRDGRLEIIRRSLKPAAGPVTVTDPVGEQTTVELVEGPGGKASGGLAVSRPGLYRIEGGGRRTLAAVGRINPREFEDVRATQAKLAPIVAAASGGGFWIGQGAGPELRRVRPGRAASGRDWMGYVQRGDYDVVGVETTPLLPGALALLLGIGGLMLAWRREGRA